MYTKDSLCHFGIKGMKWGVRRYQNEDGTRTPLGKMRERKGNGAGKKAAKIAGGVAAVGAISALGTAVRNNSDKIGEGEYSKLTKRGMSALNSSGNILGRVEDKKKEKQDYERWINRKKEAAAMSDEDLKKRVARLNLEKNYVNLMMETKPRGVWTTKDKIALGTDIVSGMVALGGLAVSIAALKKK